jgi:hypothetical protein
MYSLTVCAGDGKCCITALGTINLENPSDPAPVRVFLGIGKSCGGAPPISNLNDTASADWVEDDSITQLNGVQYSVAFPSIAADDPRCVSPCDAQRNVAIWTYFSDGSSECQAFSAFNPATYCASQSGGLCPECAEVL